jgi:hypothetical protein
MTDGFKPWFCAGRSQGASEMSSEYAPPSGSPVRVQLSRKRGWRMPPNTVKVCRPTKWGNPHLIGGCDICPAIHTREEAVAEFRAECEGNPLVLAAIREELRGKNLACWCRLCDAQDNYCHCHADVLLSLANDMSMDEVRHANLEAWKRSQSTHC